jgi:hypothetical protein
VVCIPDRKKKLSQLNASRLCCCEGIAGSRTDRGSATLTAEAALGPQVGDRRLQLYRNLHCRARRQSHRFGCDPHLHPLAIH